MKKRIFIPALFVFISTCAFAYFYFNTGISDSKSGINKSNNQNDSIFCAKLRDGVVVLTFDERELHGDITLGNGIKVFQNGTVTFPDGKEVVLKDRECIDRLGRFIDNTPIK